MVVFGTVVPFASAHFKLLEPASWLMENDLGDPQKLGPCGGTSAKAGDPLNIITKVMGGSSIYKVYPSQQLGKAFDRYDMSRTGIAGVT